MEAASSMTKIVYKIAPADDWRQAMHNGGYAGSADDIRDGFVHLSAKHQLRGTLEKHFKGQQGLILIAFEEAALGSALKWEPSRGGDLFPHLYADLPSSAMLWQRPLKLGADGVPVINEDWFAC
jgi:uncharacterized protein (DUF952 family)